MRRLARIGFVLLLLSACSKPAEKTTWQIVFQDLDAALFSVWGTGHDDVWTVGADSGSGPAVLHFDGVAWEMLSTGAQGDLWWVAGLGNDIWMVGDGGLILRYDRSSGGFESYTTPGTETLYGIQAFAADDVWAVGGDPQAGYGVLWHYDGIDWTAPSDVPASVTDAGPLFKVWGRSPDDLWVVGESGQALHHGTGGWDIIDVPTSRRLLTVHGNDTLTVAVGGFASGLIVETESDTLSDVTPPDTPQFNGVFVPPSGEAIAVGRGCAVWSRSGGSWSPVGGTPPLPLDYHAAWIDDAGGVWTVGGHIITTPFNHGILSHLGDPVPGL